MAYGLIRPLLFRMDPERAHQLALRALVFAERVPALRRWLAGHGRVDDPSLRLRLWGRDFANPVGLAAGFDKDARAVRALAALGFGFVEVGTLTPRPQPGNPQPRLFRLPEDEALINRLGFNNEGADAAACRLRQAGPLPVPLGVNIGRNRSTPNERAAEDYCRCLQVLYAYADYFVVNVSSPNTPGLRELQRAEALRELLVRIQEENGRLGRAAGGEPRPILVKIDPDLPDEALRAIVATAVETGMAGIIATNTTVSREGLRSPLAAEPGGLSGRPLAARSLRTIAAVYRLSGGRLPIIGVGGVFSGEDAYARIRAGATLVQVYTGLIYRGPFVARRIGAELVQLLKRDGFASVTDAVGCDARQILRRD